MNQVDVSGDRKLGSDGGERRQTRMLRIVLSAASVSIVIVGSTGPAVHALPSVHTGHSAAASSVEPPAEYTVTLTLTGTASLQGDDEDLLDMANSAQFQVNETWTGVQLPASSKQTMPSSESNGSMAQYSVTGSYTMSGVYDETVYKTELEPYSCSGALSGEDVGAGYELTGQPTGSSWSFTAQTLHFGVIGTTTNVGPEFSPCDGEGSFMDGVTAPFVAASFTIGASELGNHTINKTVTGPPAADKPLSDWCGENSGGEMSGPQCTFLVAWSAKITFTCSCKPSSMSEHGRNQLIEEERMRKKPYNDQKENCTVGIGHLLHYSPCNAQDYKAWNPKTDGAKLNQLFGRDVARFANALNNVQSELNLDLTQCEYDALVDLMFNAGEEAVTDPTNSGIYKALAVGDLSGVPGAITSEDYGTPKKRAKREKRTSKVKHELAKRRAAEVKEFNTPDCPCQL